MGKGLVDSRIPVIVFGANEYVLSYANQERLYVILVELKDDISVSSEEISDETILVDSFDVENVLHFVRENTVALKAHHVFSAKEAALLAAAAVGEFLQLPVTPFETVKLIKDKYKFRSRLWKLGLSPFDAETARTLQEFASAIEKIGLPAFAKPVSGTGSSGVSLVSRQSDIPKAWRKLNGRKALVEPFIEGSEVSVESFSFAGEHKIMAITEKDIGPNYVESGHVIPAEIPNEVGLLVANLTQKILSGLSLQNGPAHTEFKLTSEGPVVLETHNRTGGDMISYLTELSTGTNPFELAFGWQTGLISEETIKDLPDWSEVRKAAAVKFFFPPPGKVVSIHNVESAKSMNGVRLISLDLSPGDYVNVPTQSDERVGKVIVEAADTCQAKSRAKNVVDEVKITCSEFGQRCFG